ncbi:alpha/beta fold hydrolase [Pedomonas mirosovicensis]|uniref:alpha/beta fold hydrolase n=1 Tax=Pedomonas mirosovicensis TaxID=2908641 RepID=UPI00216A86D3|nr:alpha/beta hydrolase [Pedomonas mirosovicensis]MCH8683920.1 alpha/beta hydrolase [Pedomonas mirosovicensis]
MIRQSVSQHGLVDRGDGVRLAYARLEGKGPTVVFLHGFMSDMEGGKALALEEHCRKAGQAFLRFDCSGHGKSEGAFTDGTISRWRDDVLVLLDQRTEGPLLLVGSSMGGWLALLAALARPERVKGLVLLAAAPDFTDWGLYADFTPEQREALSRDGQVAIPSEYGPDPYIYTKALIDDGANNRLLRGPIAFTGPVRLLHGQQDPDVPWTLALEIAEKLTTQSVRLHLVKDGDHRLSRPEDLDLLCSVVGELTATIGN